MPQKVTYEVIDSGAAEVIAVKFSAPITQAGGMILRYDKDWRERVEPMTQRALEQLFETGEVNSVVLLPTTCIWRVCIRRPARRGRAVNRLKTILEPLLAQMAEEVQDTTTAI